MKYEKAGGQQCQSEQTEKAGNKTRETGNSGKKKTKRVSRFASLYG